MGRAWQANEHTGELYQHQCRHRRQCLYHAEREAQQLALTVDQARPNHLLTLTLVSQNRRAELMKSMVDRLRTRFPEIALLYVFEQNEHQLPHAHLLVRLEEHPDFKKFTEVESGLRRRFATGDLDARVIEPGSHPASYLLKTFTLRRYPDAPTAAAGINRHLDLNNGRMVHATRNFFLDESGARVKRRAALATVHDRLLRP
jgi:hypothetical protein